FQVGLAGIILNSTGVILTFRVRSLCTSFGRLTAVHLSADCAILAIFTFWCAPMTYFSYQDHDSLISRKMGQLSLYFWFVTLYSQLFIALNRFTLLFCPRIYMEFFQCRTSSLILLYNLICVGHICVYFGEGCDFYYNAETYFWEFAETPCESAISFWLDLVYGCVTSYVLLLIDVICVANMRMNASKLANPVSANERKIRSDREWRFLAQACCTELLFSFMLISFHVVSRYVSGLWPTFFSTSLIWKLSHLGNGIILFAFNQELRRAILQPKMLFSFSTITDTKAKT
ncbi:hypothetical protein PENTCL1PPCAC_14280, partial [Pristionchus entomophagus]